MTIGKDAIFDRSNFALTGHFMVKYKLVYFMEENS